MTCGQVGSFVEGWLLGFTPESLQHSMVIHGDFSESLAFCPHPTATLLHSRPLYSSFILQSSLEGLVERLHGASAMKHFKASNTIGAGITVARNSSNVLTFKVPAEVLPSTLQGNSIDRYQFFLRGFEVVSEPISRESTSVINRLRRVALTA